MEISKKTLPLMAGQEYFCKFFKNFCEQILGEARLLPDLSVLRVQEIHGAWQNDLSRVCGNEPNLGAGLDHFKQCGHLAFWVRRMGPIVEAIDMLQSIADSPGYPLSAHQSSLRDLIFGYHNEYVAFELGYQICLFYETERDDGNTILQKPVPDPDYYKTICHFMKYKSVSPHALFAIYKSLFFSR